jgi:hypothetical protein
MIAQGEIIMLCMIVVLDVAVQDARSLLHGAGCETSAKSQDNCTIQHLLIQLAS